MNLSNMRSKEIKVLLAKSFISSILDLPEAMATVVSIATFFLLYLTLRKRRRLMKTRLRASNLRRNLSGRIVYRFARNLVIMTKPKSIAVENGSDLAGKIGISIHFGPWELIGLAMIQAGQRFGVITRRYEGNVHEMIHKFRSRFGIRTFYPDQLFKIRDFLKTGGTIGMMIDGEDLQSRLPHAQRLAQLLGTELKKGCILPRHGKLHLLTRNVDFQKLIASYPEHYAWFYIPHN